MAEVSLSVVGDPASQGSHAIMQGRIVQVNSKKHKAWRNAITQTALATLPADWTPIDEPCEAIINFYLPRGKTVSRGLPTVAPDLWPLDKLVRAVFDSLKDSGIVVDDSRIVRVSARKLYAQGIEPGATIEVRTLN